MSKSSTWCFTFSSNTKLANNFVRVAAYTENEARRKMFSEYGGEWAFVYLDGVKFGRQIAEFDLKEVPFGEPNERN